MNKSLFSHTHSHSPTSKTLTQFKNTHPIQKHYPSPTWSLKTEKTSTPQHYSAHTHTHLLQNTHTNTHAYTDTYTLYSNFFIKYLKFVLKFTET